jgi:hypothetical protein
MEEMNDGTTSTGMGGSIDATVATQTSEPTVTTDTNAVMSEEDALRFLGGVTNTIQPTINNQPNNAAQDANTQVVDNNEPFDIGDIDMSMFGITEQPVIPTIQTQPQMITQEQQQAQMIQDIYNKLNNPNTSENDVIEPEELSALSALTEKLQKAGLLPSGLSEEDKTLLQEAKAMRDEIKQNREIQQQQAEFTAKVNSIDEYSKTLEGLIPGYDTSFMINVVSQISKQNPQAGQQILNNPAMLTQLWAKYGAKAQPRQQQTNVISNGSSQVGRGDLLEKVRSGNGTPDDEARLLASL